MIARDRDAAGIRSGRGAPTSHQPHASPFQMASHAHSQPKRTLEEWIAEYRNEATVNEKVHRDFTALVQEIPFLRNHRDVVERNAWGFGDRAFHYSWYLILQYAARTFEGPVRCLEIGVYKGQVISLWSLISQQLDTPFRISAISPLQGVESTNRFLRKLQRIVRSRLPSLRQSYRKDAAVGNFYPDVDYQATLKNVFAHFKLDSAQIELFKGLSTDAAIQDQWSGRTLEILYIDGDHSFEVSSEDIRVYAPLVVRGGICVLDDASYFLPGEGFHKGVETVSRAAESMSDLGFDNVLNVGHNRVYIRR